ncbi:hypothetical protein J6590_091023, partial [Homalodisca vitripennis]
TITYVWAGELLARTGSLSGHPSKQQLRLTLIDPVTMRQPLYPLNYATGNQYIASF